MPTVPTGPGQAVALEEITDPYRVRSVGIVAELDFLKDGKTFATARTSPMVCLEFDFFPGLVEFLKRQGITLANPTPVEVAPIS